jgi:hypothetical protein
MSNRALNRSLTPSKMEEETTDRLSTEAVGALEIFESLSLQIR